MVVAAGALEGQRHEGRADGVDTIRDPVLAEFLGHRAALVGLAVDAVEGGGKFLLAGGIGQKVARELMDDELIKRQVSVERADHPVAIGPGFDIDIRLISERIGVARHIKPCGRPVLAETR